MIEMSWGIQYAGEIIHAGFDTKKDAEEWLSHFKRTAKVVGNVD